MFDNYSDAQLIQFSSKSIEDELRARGYSNEWHKKIEYAGVIYILVNPAFPNLVKIGYSDDIMRRLRDLNSNSALPDPFHVYATYKVKKRLRDLQLHNLIDSLDSDLRHTANREFYEMSAEKAYGILSAIAQINGDENLLVKNPCQDEFFDADYEEPMIAPVLQAERLSNNASSSSAEISAYTLCGIRTAFTSYKNILLDCAEILLRKYGDPEFTNRVLNSRIARTRRYALYSMSSNDLPEYDVHKQISNGMYVCTNYSAHDILKKTELLVDLFEEKLIIEP